MAKTTAPVLSFGASGQIADTLVFSSWKGVPYARRYVKPANPQTTKQQQTRGVFAMLNGLWLYLGSIGSAPWNAYATGRPLLGRNAFIGENVKTLRTTPPATDMADFIGSPGAKGGLPPVSMTPTPSSTQISMAVTVPDAPDGWTLTAAQGVCLTDQDPQLPFTGIVVEAEDTSASYAVVFTGLTTATDYVVSIWLKWEKANGEVAYSRSLTDLVTTS